MRQVVFKTMIDFVLIYRNVNRTNSENVMPRKKVNRVNSRSTAALQNTVWGIHQVEEALAKDKTYRQIIDEYKKFAKHLDLREIVEKVADSKQVNLSVAHALVLSAVMEMDPWVVKQTSLGKHEYDYRWISYLQGTWKSDYSDFYQHFAKQVVNLAIISDTTFKSNRVEIYDILSADENSPLWSLTFKKDDVLLTLSSYFFYKEKGGYPFFNYADLEALMAMEGVPETFFYDRSSGFDIREAIKNLPDELVLPDERDHLMGCVKMGSWLRLKCFLWSLWDRFSSFFVKKKIVDRDSNVVSAKQLDTVRLTAAVRRKPPQEALSLLSRFKNIFS